MDERLKQERLSIINDLFIPMEQYEEVFNEEHDNIVIIECEEGHRYKIDYSADDFDDQIRRGCPFCKNRTSPKVMNKCRYNVNLLNLQEYVNTIPEAQGFKSYEFFDMEGRQIQPSELTIYSSVEIIIKLKEGCEDVLNLNEWTHRPNNIGIILIDFSINPRKGIVEYIEDINESNLNYYTYYSDNIYRSCENKKNYINYMFTKEGLEIYKENTNRYYHSEIFYDIELKNRYCPELIDIVNEPSLSKRMHMRGIEGYKVPVFKLINKKINQRQSEITKRKRIKKKIKELKQEGEDILKTKDDLINQKEELEKKITAIDKQINKIKKELKELTGEDIYIGPKPTLLEWCQQPENKELGDIIISQYLPRKNKKKLDEIEFDSDETIYIKGKHGSAYKTTPLTITKNKRVLPKLPRGTSYPELFIFYYLQSIFPEAIHKGKALKKVEYDITIPEKKTCIEYNGSAFHKGKYARPEVDANKVYLCKNYGVNYIRIEDDGDTFEPKCQDWLISVKYDDSKKQEQLMLVCKFIVNNKLHCNKDGISIKEIEKKIRLYY